MVRSGVTRADHLSSLAWFCARLVIALMLVFAIVGLFQAPIAAGATAKPWIGPDQPSVIPVWIYVIVFGISVLLIIAGYQTPIAICATGFMLIAIAWERLLRNPFTNLTADILLLLVLGLSVLAAGPEKDRWSLDHSRGRVSWPEIRRWSWITLFLRLFIGGIFFLQGTKNLFLGAGPLVFAERLYVKAYAGMMPEPLLWIAGVSNPFLQFGIGLCLILGIFTRSAGALGLLFLVSIIFGHLMKAPLTAPGAMRDFATANFFVMLAVIIAAARGNLWSLDGLRRRSGARALEQRTADDVH
jgi:uncharacterized membrane protein YphA (DoxX/SURF4 family)